MVTFVIFWAAVFAMLFFVLGFLFKALASAFNALVYSICKIFSVGGPAILAVIALYLLYEIVDGIVKKGIVEVIGTILLLFLVFGIIGAIIGGLGEIILEIVIYLVEISVVAISFVLEIASAICEKGYVKFLTVIIKNLDKC